MIASWMRACNFVVIGKKTASIVADSALCDVSIPLQAMIVCRSRRFLAVYHVTRMKEHLAHLLVALQKGEPLIQKDFQVWRKKNRPALEFEGNCCPWNHVIIDAWTQ